MQTIKEVIDSARQELERTSSSAKLDAEILMMQVLNIELYRLVMDIDRVLNEDEINQFNLLLERRKKGEPVAYIIGESAFMGYDFIIKKGILVPRPETEGLVEHISEYYQKSKHLKGLDMCTGSGCIAISLAKMNKNIQMVATDVSEIAIDVCKQNIKHLKAKNITVIQSDLFESVPNHSYDFIVSNPPYIASDEIDRLMVDVKDYEPVLALDGGKSGLDFYEKIIVKSKDYLKAGGGLFFEIGHNQGKAVRELMDDNHYERIIVKKDLSGRDRIVCGFKAKGGK